MITVAVAAILLLIAIPSFQHAISNSNLTGTHNDLLATLRYARTEAISRGQDVRLAPIGGAWNNGWQVLDSSDAVLREHNAVEARYAITLVPAGTLTFEAQGTITQRVCFTIQDTHTSANTDPRIITMLPSGSTYAAPNCAI